MKPALRILIIEDSEDDALLVLHQIRKGGYDIVHERVETADAMKAALKAKTWDIVLSDYKLPHFNGLEALTILKESGIDLPSILISGTIGEEIAVDAMKGGANDYIMKNNLRRLLPAVERELREAKIRAERRRLEQQQKQAEARLRLQGMALEAAANCIDITDRDGTILWVNNAFTELTGYDVDEAVGQNHRILKSGAQDASFYGKLWETILSGRVWHGQMVNRRKDGRLYTEEVTITPVQNQDGDITNFIAVKQNITERLRAEEKIVASLHEKEMLLKEIHHRVKNNLQIVCSLLSIQSQNLSSPESQNFFHETETRVRSMAMVHEKLYHSADLAGIDFGEYLNGLAHHIMSGFNRKEITYAVNSQRVMLGIDVAIPCGLIANELITNAFKHGFKNRVEGKILITIARVDARTVQLSVQDDGVGFPPNEDFRKMASMGMTLINSLTDQVGGKVTMKVEGGTTFVITFPS